MAHTIRISREQAEMRQCLVWNLHNTQGLTYQKIANALGISKGRAAQLSHEYERRCEIKQKFINADTEIYFKKLSEWRPEVRNIADVLNESLNKC